MDHMRPGAAPLPEYPRPQMLRDSFLSLNGLWDYAVTPLLATPGNWDGKIMVPFSPGSPLSGVARVLQPDETLWYKTAFTLPTGFIRGRVLLHFGAVNQECTVFTNGCEAGRHQGGSLPFHFDITALLREGAQELMVQVSGKTGASGRQHPQTASPGRGLQNGIWQTVWLESVPHTYISALTITPLYDEAAVCIEVSATGGALAGQLDIFAHKTLVKRVDFQANQPLRVALPGFISWHPGRPFLYTLRVWGGQDAVESYFGMRKLHLAADAVGRPHLMLNNKPFLAAGVADQGLHPGGMCTAPSDQAILDDLRFAKECGFNMIRKHGKIESLRWYCHCDRLGLLVWQDLPAGDTGCRSRLWERLLPAVMRPAGRRARHPSLQGSDGRQGFVQTAQEVMQVLYNTPSLGVWGLFPAGQGRFAAPDNSTGLRRCDPTRLLAHSGGRHNQGDGDILSIPLTRRNARLYKKPMPLPHNHVFFLTQLARRAFSLPPAGEARRGPGQPCPTRAAFADAIAGLYKDYLLPQRKNGLCGFFFYQLTDAGGETSGLLPFDRTTPKLHAKGMATLNRLFLDE